MTQSDPQSHRPPEHDPRLLLPEWLRDAPDDVPMLPAEFVTPEPRAATKAQGDEDAVGAHVAWQAPPPPVAAFDPATLIAPNDVPDWIRSMPAREKEPGGTAGPPPIETTRTSLDEVVPPAHAVIEEEIDAPTSIRRASDLTETRFALLAGGALVAILAVIALFYF